MGTIPSRGILYAAVLPLVLLLSTARAGTSDDGANGGSANASLTTVQVVDLRPTTLVRDRDTQLVAKLSSVSCSEFANVPVSPQLHLQNALGSQDVYFSGQLSADCTSLKFFAGTKGLDVGQHQFSIFLNPKHELPCNSIQAIQVENPPKAAFAGDPWLRQQPDLDLVIIAPVELSDVPTAPVTVTLTAELPSTIEVLDGPLTWNVNEGGRKNFTARLRSVPASRKLRLELVPVSNAQVDDKPATAQLPLDKLPVPVFSFEANQGVYRGDPFRIPLQVDSTRSSNASVLRYETFVIASRYYSGTPSYKVEHALTSSGVLRINTSDGDAPPPLALTLNWTSVPFDAEYRVGVRLLPLSNAQVKEQSDEIAMFVFGVQYGTCPPGTSMRANSSSEHSPSFSAAAPLQDLRLEVCCDEDDDQAYNVSLFPAFTPRTTTYKAIIPWGKRSVSLAFTSLRVGDIVSVDCTCCNRTLKFTIASGAETQVVPVRNASCDLSISVATPNATSPKPADDSPLDAAAERTYSSSTDLTSSAAAATAAEPPADPPAATPEALPAPPGYQTLTQYQVHLAPLVDPELLRLKAVSLANASVLTVLCGQPTVPMVAIAEEGDGNATKALEVRRAPYALDECGPEACLFVNASDLAPDTQLLPEALHPGAPGVEFVTGTFSLGAGLAMSSNRSYIRVPITLTSNDNVSSETYTVVVLTAPTSVPLPFPAKPNASAALERRLAITCASDSQVPSGLAISSEATTTTTATPNETISLQHAFFAARNASFPTHPALNPNCSICPNGSYTSRPNAAVCQLCPPGHYALLKPWPHPLPTTCLACGPGTYTFSWGSASCRPCFPGTYAPNRSALYCSICPDSYTSNTQGAARCSTRLTSIRSLYNNTTYADIVSFGVVVNNTAWDQLSNLTGINASSVTILSLLIRTDLSSLFSIPLEAVVVTSTRYLPNGGVNASRSLLLNVSATVPSPPDKPDDSGAASESKQLSADDLVERLNEDPDGVFMRTTKMTGATVSVTGLQVRRRVRLRRNRHHLLLHAILWPVLFGVLFICGGGGFWWCKRNRRRNRPRGLLDSSLRWVRGSPSSSQGSDQSELELHEFSPTLSPPRRQRVKQFITDIGQYERFHDLHDTSPVGCHSSP